MNYNKINGWYYINGNKKSPAWSGVEFLYKFLTTNKGIGPYGKEIKIEETMIGDIVQISFDGKKFTHSQIIIDKLSNDLDNILIAAHTEDSYMKSIATYYFQKIRFIHIEGVKKW